MSKYQVVIDGKVVWQHTTRFHRLRRLFGRETYEGFGTFPEQYRNRPKSGEVHLIVDGETIGIQVPIDPEIEQAILAVAPALVIGKAG